MRKRNGRARRARFFEVVVKFNPRERGPYKYTVDVPALPGCFSEGRTHAEAVENVKDAIALMLAARRESIRKDTELVEVIC